MKLLSLSSFKKSQLMLCSTTLFDQTSFYPAFQKTLRSCKEELIIESPFMTMKRINFLLPELKYLQRHDVKIIINTRSPEEHTGYLRFEAEQAIEVLANMGIRILFTGGLHRKLAIIDRNVLWEGSLNILSQNDSCEIMRRTSSRESAEHVIRFTKLDKFL